MNRLSFARRLANHVSETGQYASKDYVHGLRTALNVFLAMEAKENHDKWILADEDEEVFVQRFFEALIETRKD